MDSLDSTVGTAQREKIKQIRHKQIDVPVHEDVGKLGKSTLVERYTNSILDKDLAYNLQLS